MTVDQINSWASAGESETLELKLTTGQRREAMQTLCAMLNHRGGRVMFGVSPHGRVLGQQVSDHTVEEVAQEVREIEPTALPSIERVSIGNGREVLVVSVAAGKSRPYSYRGRAYRPIGNTTQVLSREQYHTMLFERVHAEQRWENQPARGWQIEDLNLTEITRTVEEAIRRGRMDEPGTREPQAILRGLKLMTGDTLLRAALVLFGKDERMLADFPQCLLRVARFVGVDKNEFSDNRQYRGNTFNLLSAADRFLLAHVPIASRVIYGQIARADEPLYPLLAVREALVNAICHRDYTSWGGSIGLAMFDDRLEVTSSGPLHFGLTPASLFEPHESHPWNPLIASVFYRRGIIESWGRGTLKMAELTTSAGLPRPEIEDANDTVLVRFRPTRYVPPQRGTRGFTDRQQRILSYLAENPEGAAIRDIASALGASEASWTIRDDLGALKTFGLVRSVGRGRGALWVIAPQ